LDLIQKHMLVPEAKNRESGRMIREKLREIRDECRKDAFAHKDVEGYDEDFQEGSVSSAAGVSTYMLSKLSLPANCLSSVLRRHVSRDEGKGVLS
jgi:hypothetical protein